MRKKDRNIREAVGGGVESGDNFVKQVQIFHHKVSSQTQWDF